MFTWSKKKSYFPDKKLFLFLMTILLFDKL
jgi:hypothetical protein